MKRELYHYGVPGMRWGVRRYQNDDGTLTDKGRERYRDNEANGKYLVDPEGYTQTPPRNAPVDDLSLQSLTERTVRVGRDYVQSMSKFDGSIFDLGFASVQSSMPRFTLSDYEDW